MNDLNKQSGWAKLWRQPKNKWFFGIPLGAVLFAILGVIGTAGFNVTMEVTSTNEFCTGCHVPGYANEEFLESSHGTSRSGMDVQCADCHVAKEFVPKMMRKVVALKEIYYHTIGTYNEREDYEAYKATMQTRVHDHMRATDSKTCRSCHDTERMNFDKQKRMAAMMHKRAFAVEKDDPKYKTCIDCHAGKVAHKKVN